MSTAAELKDEGNKLYAAKDFTAAYVKYSKAIELDGSQAMYWANRAACLMAMKRYMDAGSDCQEALKIDPNYTKVWMRLGAVHTYTAQYDKSMEMYQKAQLTLPKENLTPEQEKLARQCDLEFRAARERRDKPPDVMYLPTDKEFPWIRAQKMVEKLQKQRHMTMEILRSSAWVMAGAYAEFKQGLDMVRIIRKQGDTIVGMNGGLTGMTNGIMRDSRVFHIDDEDFPKKYNMQIRMETQRDDACVTGGAQACIDHALKLQKKGGWDAVRPSVATTVRVWIMRGFLENGLSDNLDASLEFYNRAVEVLEWGRQVWRNEPKENRGAVFERTFLRGVKSLRLEALAKATLRDPEKYPLDDVYEAAQEIIQDIDTSEGPDGPDPAFLGSFYAYPKGHAQSVLGIYYREMAKLHRDEPEVFNDYLEKCAEVYIRAAVAYPPDDEYNATYLNCTLEINYHRRAPASVVLPLFELLAWSMKCMPAIWEFSTTMMSDGRAREHLWVRMLMRGDELRENIKKGKVKKEDPISWDEVFG